jgi:phage tail sheath protein FI
MVGDNAGASDRGGTVLDSDRFNNNVFTLENVQVVTKSNADGTALANPKDIPDVYQWKDAMYRRDGQKVDIAITPPKKTGGLTGHQEGRFLDVTKDFHLGSAVSNALGFTFPLQGGFNGTNIFDTDKSMLTDAAVRREYDDTSQQSNDDATTGPTVAAYRRAVDVMGETANVDIQLLAIPGQRHPVVVDYAMDSVEDRFDALYLMDIELKDELDEFMTGSSLSTVNAANTVDRFTGRGLDSSFGAAYFPDVNLDMGGDVGVVPAPATVAVLGAFANSDAVGEPWFAPAGLNRTQLPDVTLPEVQFYQPTLDKIYDADINPIVKFPATKCVVWGQKTLLKAQSSLDRINVRRLLIEIRRRVKLVGDLILFEPNRAETLARFSALVNPILADIQQRQGLDNYRVQIDTTTTTQADIENNTLRGKIFLQPTKSVEFVTLDFVLSNTTDTPFKTG